MNARRPFSTAAVAPKRAPRGLAEFVAAALCVWAAGYHTPAGALVRHLVAKVSSKPTSARPLLAYYSGGTWDAADLPLPSLPVGNRVPVDIGPSLAGLAPLPAVGRGVYLTWSQLPAAGQRPLLDLAARHAVTVPACRDEAALVAAITQTLERESADLHGLDAAVLAAFAGHDSARYAQSRAHAEGTDASLEDLAAWLPNDAGPVLASASRALSLGTAYALAWPLEVPARITSPFGYRTHPITGVRQLHTGLDLAVVEGTQVHVVADGVVRRASEDALNGRVVIVDHGRGVSTAYCHNSELLVRPGAVLKAGDVVARSGNTGRSTGPHVHYQVELSRTPVDPLLFRTAPAAVASVSEGRPSDKSGAMHNIKVPVQLVRERQELGMPTYQTAQSSGMDLQADLTDDIYLEPLGRALVATGLAFAIPDGFEGQIRPRSGMGHKQGLTVLNSPGTIDSDYRGEVKVLIANISNKAVVLRRGDRIAQMVFAPVVQATLIETEGLTETGRGTGGFGSTGV